jgi:acetylornithine deacetylase/succinyl-diaminopimelate desuccinylase-like protein
MLKTIAVSLMFILAWGTSVPADEIISAVRTWHRDNAAAIIRNFAELLAIPNVASDTVNIRRNADYIIAEMTQRGLTARLLETPGAPPTVYGEWAVPGARRTVVVYAHYDGQPADPADWSTQPWQPVLKSNSGAIVSLDAIPTDLDGEWRIQARSAGDDKVAVMAVLAAVEAMKSCGIEPSVNLKFFFEGEEEAGSSHLGETLRAHAELLKADGWFFCDGPVHQSRRQQLTFGARGVMGAELTVYGPSRDLHSGHYGNWAPNPIAILADLLAAMRDPDGHINIAGINDEVRPLSELEQAALKAMPDVDAELRAELALGASEADNARLVERIMQPALNYRGLRSGGVGEYTRNAIPTEATASIEFRLVPDQNPMHVRELTEAFIRGRGFHIVHETPTAAERAAHARILRLQWEGGYRASRTPMDAPFSRAVIGVLDAALETPPLRLPSFGGSLPMYIFEDILGAPMIVLPIANHDNNQHGPDENLRLQNLWDGIEIYVVLFAGLGEAWQ